MTDYVFETEPYEHQRCAFEDSWSAEYYALLMEMGTGKSKVAIDTIAALYEAGEIDAALIVAPKGVYANWARGEVGIHMPRRIDRLVVQWVPAKTKKFEEEMSGLLDVEPNHLRIFVMNVEAYSSPRGARAAYDFLKRYPKNLMAVDESTTIKNRTAKRTKNIMVLGKYAKYRRILTGSPVTKSPLDLFSQCAFLSPDALGIKSFFAFQSRYAIIQRRQMGPRSFQEVVGYRRLDELSEKLDRFSNRILKADCLDLPDKVYLRRDVPLTPEQKTMYAQMKKLALAKFENGELATTASILTQIMRLQQICCGFLTPDDGEVQALPSNRLDELMEVVEEASGKVIIWATYTHDIHAIRDALAAEYGPSSVSTYYGETPQDERQDIVEAFQDGDNPLRFFVGQPRTGGYGITLTAASTVVYYSNSYDLEIRIQSEDRAHRIGQKKSVTYVDLVSPGTIDEKILTALRGKIDIAAQVLGEKAADWII